MEHSEMYQQSKRRFSITSFALLSGLSVQPAFAHDPVFALGPHVLFKGGIEIAPEIFIDRAGDKDVNVTGLELTYGLTGDWSAGINIPYVGKKNNGISENGQGDLRLFTKYRFWRKDGPGVQQSMTVAVKVKTDTGNSNVSTGTTDTLLGLAYGYESRKWYRWATLRYLSNGENDAGKRRGDKIFYDLVGGIRMHQTSYLEPDTVWLLELNGEYSERNELDGIALTNSGGNEVFVSPGIFWTLRNFAVKAGVQIPVLSQLNENQQETDYRARLILEWHL
ncbi:MAG: transporter [Gammaproteobacteria bacterium]